MGVVKRSRKRYLSVSKGKLGYKPSQSEIDEGNPEIVTVNYQDDQGVDKITYKIYIDGFIGMITNMEYTDGDYGKKFELAITDMDETFTLQLTPSGSMHNDLINVLMNTDFNENIELYSFLGKTNKGKDKSVIMIKQRGENVKRKCTKANPGNMPQATQIQGGIDDGKWDFKPIDNFFFNWVTNEGKALLEQTGNISNSSEKKSVYTEEQPEEKNNPAVIKEEPSTDLPEADDDLPF